MFLLLCGGTQVLLSGALFCRSGAPAFPKSALDVCLEEF
jgi:hypothetical protein